MRAVIQSALVGFASDLCIVAVLSAVSTLFALLARRRPQRAVRFRSTLGARGSCIVALVLVTATVAGADYLADRARPLVEASHAEIRAIHLGRWMAQKRWDELLDEALYSIAPKGRWGPDHPAWSAARAALADAVRRKSVDAMRGETGTWVREVVNEHYSSLEPAESAQAVAFYESPGGQVFRDFRERVLAEASYGLPFVIETESHAAYTQEKETARERLLNLPDDQTQAVYDFNHSKVGELLLGIENNIVADVIGNIMRSDLDSILIQHGDEIARTVRSAVPGMPPPSNKAYLGTATMRPDRSLDLAIEYRDGYRLAGTYRLTYAPDDRQWRDIADQLVGIAPGETRFLYRDPAGRLSDAP